MIMVNYVALASVFMVVGRTVDMDIFIIQLSFTMPNGAMEAGKVQKRAVPAIQVQGARQASS